MIDKNLLETVVLLPSNVLDGTYVQPLVFVTNKNKQRKGIVRFVDASHCFEEMSFSVKNFDGNKKAFVSLTCSGHNVMFI